MGLEARQLANIERPSAIALWGFAGWGLYRLSGMPIGRDSVAGLLLAQAFVVPGMVVLLNLPVLMMRWVNWKDGGSRRFQAPISNAYYVAGACRLSMQADLTKPVRREAILADVREICSSRAVCSAALAAGFLGCWLISGKPWMLAWGCPFAATLGWIVWPRSRGFRYSTGLLRPAETARSLCLSAMAQGLNENHPLQDWHPSYFEIVARPSDRSQDESTALELNYLRALLTGDLQTAQTWMERRLALIPDCGPDYQYWILGAALHFYAAISKDEAKGKELLMQIRVIRWEMPLPTEAYIEAAMAIAEGHPGDAVRIAEDELKGFGAEDSVRIQLRRTLLRQCIEAAK